MSRTPKIGLYWIIALLVVVGTLYEYRGQIYNEMKDFDLIPTPEPFTELYFLNYPKLSLSEVVPGTVVAFSFDIHNLEGATTAYPYQVYYRLTNGVTRLIDIGTTTLANNQLATFQENYKIKDLHIGGNIVVYLENINQYIHFSLPNNDLSAVASST